MRTGVLRMSLAVLGLLLSAGGPEAAHASASPSFVTMYSDGDWVGQGEQRVYHSGNSSIAANGTLEFLTVGVSGGTSGDAFTLRFAAPPGTELVPGGVYLDAQRASFRAAGRPGIDISGDGRGCNKQAGNFEVKDIALSGNVVTRLWIVYAQYCEGGSRALWGEVRLGLPTAGDPLLVPGIVRWPAGDIGRPATSVPVTVVAADRPVELGTATLEGAGSGQFTVRADECSGRTLTLGSSCQIWVRFVPDAAGTHIAALRLSAGGAPRELFLEGFAYGGRTRVDMKSDPGDFMGQGKTWTYDAATSEIVGGGSRTSVYFGLDSAGGDWWDARFVPGQGDILVAGATYSNATRYPFNGTGPGMDVSGEGRGCSSLTGSFTVLEADFAPDGRLRSGAVSFVQHCSGGAPAFRGTWQYRAGDDTTLAPWLGGTVSPVGRAVAWFTPASGSPGTAVTLNGSRLAGATSVTFGGVAAAFTVVSNWTITATVPAGASTGRIVVTTPGGTATSRTDFAVATPPPPPPGESLLPNGSFETDLAGWFPFEATATRVFSGMDGSYAAHLAFAGDGKTFGLVTSPLPATGGEVYDARAYVRSSTPGRRICLVVNEWGLAPRVLRLGRSCVTGTGSWQAFPPLRYRAYASGTELELWVEQLGAKPGDSFDLDSVSLRAAAAPSGATGAPSPAPVPVQQHPATVESEASSTSPSHRLGAGFQALPL